MVMKVMLILVMMKVMLVMKTNKETMFPAACRTVAAIIPQDLSRSLSPHDGDPIIIITLLTIIIITLIITSDDLRGAWCDPISRLCHVKTKQYFS